MKSVIAVCWKGQSEFDPKNGSGNKEIGSFKKAIEKTNSEIRFIEPNSEDDKESLKIIEKEVMADYDEHSLMLSMDHAVTYSGLKAAKIKDLALIVFDQHMDIYSYRTHGKQLNRANIFRIALDQNLVSKIIFVGVRNSEAALLREIKGLPKHIEASASRDRKSGIFAGFEDKVEIILSEEISSFEEGLFKALDMLKKDGFKNIGIDIDLDVFDSKEILGVEYNEHSPMEFLKNFILKNKGMPSELKPLFEKLMEMGKKEAQKQALELYKKIKSMEKPSPELEWALDEFLWYSQQQSEKGIPASIPESLKAKFNENLKKNGQKLCYRGITEWIPSNDRNGRTQVLVEQLLDFLG